MKQDNNKRRRKPKVISVVCAVCSCNVKESEWIEHIAKEHNYLAWKEGEEPLVSNSQFYFIFIITKFTTILGCVPMPRKHCMCAVRALRLYIRSPK